MDHGIPGGRGRVDVGHVATVALDQLDVRSHRSSSCHVVPALGEWNGVVVVTVEAHNWHVERHLADRVGPVVALGDLFGGTAQEVDDGRSADARGSAGTQTEDAGLRHHTSQVHSG